MNSDFSEKNDVKINNLIRVKKYLTNNVFYDFDKIIVPISFLNKEYGLAFLDLRELEISYY